MISEIKHIYTVMRSKKYPLSVIDGKLTLIAIADPYARHHKRADEAEKTLNRLKHLER